MRRKSPDDDDIERIAETINNLDVQDEIIDYESFEEHYDDYFDADDNLKKSDNYEELKREVFTELNKKKRGTLYDKSIFKQAGGKSFQRDRQQTSETVVTSRKEYKRRGARRVDLKGYDTSKGSIKQRFPLYKRIKSKGIEKTVYAQQVQIKIKGKPITRFRDPLGRFTKN